MDESMTLFQEMINSPVFQATPVILLVLCVRGGGARDRLFLFRDDDDDDDDNDNDNDNDDSLTRRICFARSWHVCRSRRTFRTMPATTSLTTRRGLSRRSFST